MKSFKKISVDVIYQEARKGNSITLSHGYTTKNVIKCERNFNIASSRKVFLFQIVTVVSVIPAEAGSLERSLILASAGRTSGLEHAFLSSLAICGVCRH